MAKPLQTVDAAIIFEVLNARTPKQTSSSRQARKNILVFVQKTGKIVFSFDDVDVNSITLRKLAGNGVVVPHGTESTENITEEGLQAFGTGDAQAFGTEEYPPSRWVKDGAFSVRLCEGRHHKPPTNPISS